MGSRMASAILACAMALAVPMSAGAEETGLQGRMVAAVNDVRAQHGLEAFRGSPILHRSARSYARWMLRADYFGHLGTIRASSRFSLLGETLAQHSGREPQVSRTLRRWMHSPPHRALILHPDLRWLGAGIARGAFRGRDVTHWVLHFGGGLSAAGASLLPGSLPADQLPSEASTPSAPPEILSTTSAAGAAVASAAP
jgi:uncharacterized protein YkwD